MRQQLPEKLSVARVEGDPTWGPYGAFRLMGPCGTQLMIIASGADADDVMSQGWEHVSVSTPKRTPNWTEMCLVKDLFWDEEETVIQFHPPKSQYVNNHPHVLHLWKSPHEVQLPPSILVGVKALGILTEQEAHVIRALMNRALTS